MLDRSLATKRFTSWTQGLEPTAHTEVGNTVDCRLANRLRAYEQFFTIEGDDE